MGQDLVYDEMSILTPGAPTEFTAIGEGGPQPGEGPTKAEREAGFFDLLFVGIAPDGRKVKVSVQGDRDPGYGSTSKMLAEAAVCLVKDAPDVPGGVWTPGAALQGRLVARLQQHAGLRFRGRIVTALGEAGHQRRSGCATVGGGVDGWPAGCSVIPSIKHLYASGDSRRCTLQSG